MVSNWLHHDASKHDCDWACLKENSMYVQPAFTCYCPCCDIALAKAKPTKDQIMWVPLGTPARVANFADSNNTMLLRC